MDTNQIQKLRLDHPRESDLDGERRAPRHFRSLMIVLGVVCAGFAGAFLWSKRAELSDRARAAAPPTANLEAPTPAPGTFTAAGYLEPIPPYPITVSALVAGRVDEFNVLEGTRVKVGDVVAKLNSELPQKRMAELKAELAVNAEKLAHAEQLLARIEKLATTGAVSSQDLDDARAKAAIALAEQSRLQASIDLGRWQIESARVRAPANGVIFERLVQPGEVVSPDVLNKKDAAIATIYDPAKIQAWVDVNQRDASRVKLGQRAEVLIDAEPGKTYAGRVMRILPRASLQKNTVQVKVAIDDPSPTLRPDMSVKIIFPMQRRARNLPYELR